jgi:hypothetical protein
MTREAARSYSSASGQHQPGSPARSGAAGGLQAQASQQQQPGTPLSPHEASELLEQMPSWRQQHLAAKAAAAAAGAKAGGAGARAPPGPRRRWVPTVHDSLNPKARQMLPTGLGCGGEDLYSAAHVAKHVRVAAGLMVQLEESKKWKQVAHGGLQMWHCHDKERKLQQFKVHCVIEQPMLVSGRAARLVGGTRVACRGSGAAARKAGASTPAALRKTWAHVSSCFCPLHPPPEPGLHLPRGGPLHCVEPHRQRDAGARAGGRGGGWGFWA